MDLLLRPTTAPHLIVGVPYNSNPNDAVAAFARKTRRVKADPNSPFSIEDLTAALAEIQHGDRDNAVLLEYAVPCNPDVYQPSSTFAVDGTTFGVSDPCSSLLAASAHSQQSTNVAITLLAAAIHALFDWDWQQAGELARECLRISKSEDERDEALNVLAASLALTGQSDRAMQALQKAVEGRWNLNLQANLALIATTLDPRLAATQMSFLIDGANSADEKLRAVRMAIGLWRSSHNEDLDEDELDTMPAELMSSIYGMLGHAELTEEEFFDIALFVARVDSHGPNLKKALKGSPHRNSLSAKVVQARAEGFKEFLDQLVICSSNDPNRERPWLQDQVDSFVRAVTSGLLEDEGQRASIAIAFSMLQNGLDCSDFARVGLRFLLIGCIHTILEEGAQPADVFFKWHNEAGSMITQLGLTEEQTDLLIGLRDDSGMKLALLTHRVLFKQYRQIESAANQIISRMSGIMNRLTANRAAVRSVSMTIVKSCTEAIDDYQRAILLVTDREIRDELKQVQDAYREIKKRMLVYA